MFAIRGIVANGSCAVRLVCVIASMLVGGCLSMEQATSDVTHEEYVVVRDYGWRLFNTFPIFRTEITSERVQRELLDYAAKKGKRAEDLVYNNYDTVVFNLPLIAFTIPIPYIICYREIQLSGTLRQGGGF